MDPRTAASIWGGVELGMVSAATVQIAHFYNLPVNIYGFSTNSYDYDIQNGYERMQNAMLPALAGADELSGIGQIGAGVMSSLAQIVLDNEIAASVKQARRGITVDADSLAFDVINEAATGKGDFISSQHTRRYTRNGEILLPRLAERKTWDGWDSDGRGGMVARAHAEAERILAQHQPEPLSREQETELDKILDSADDELSRI